MNVTSLDPSLQSSAEAIFALHGLTPERAVALFYESVRQQRDLPFSVETPNAQTLAAMQELRSGKGQSYRSMSDLYADLDAEDGDASA